MRLRAIVPTLTLIVAAVTAVAARQAGPAQIAFEAARKTEVVDRNLMAAIVQYREVASKYASDVTVASTALLHLAGCYEQLGQPEARATYARLLKDYPASTSARIAREKLVAQRNAGLSVTHLSTGADGSPSADGRYFTDTDTKTGALVARDVRTGRTRQLTAGDPNSASGFAIESVPSPDGRQVAYAWVRTDAKAMELRIVDYAGGQSRILCCRDKPGEVSQSETVVTVFGWSPDGKQILFSLGRLGPSPTPVLPSEWTFELMTIPAKGGVPVVIKQLDALVNRAGWSPDGQFIAYDARSSPGQVERTVFIVRPDGSNSVPLFANAANNHMLDWFPDGKRILFLSDRDGSNGIWAQSVSEGTAVGEPIRVKALAGTVRGQGFTRDGSYYYNVYSPKDDVLTARIDEVGTLSTKVEPLQSRFAGAKKHAIWSPDGSRLAYIQVPPDAAFEPSLSIQTISTGQIRTIAPQLRRIANPAWMPDGSALIVEGTRFEGGQGLFRLEIATGAVSAIGELSSASATARHLPAVSPSGRELYYTLGSGLDIQAHDLNSGAVRTVFGGPVLSFALSPDGRFLAVLAGASVNKGDPANRRPLQLVSVTGGESRVLGEELIPAHSNWGIAWSGDGRQVLFSRHLPGQGIALWRQSVGAGVAQPTGIVIPRSGWLVRVSVRPDGLLAISTRHHETDYWVMRNIPQPTGR